MKSKEKGQAILIVIFLFAVVLTLSLVTFSSSVSNLQDILVFKDGAQTLFLTESALENGLLRLLRDPSYAGEALQLEGVPCIIEVIDTPQRIRAWCDSGRTIRKLEAQVSFVDGQMLISQITEIE